MVAGSLELNVLDEGQHALVSSHEAIRGHVGLPRQQPGGEDQRIFFQARDAKAALAQVCDKAASTHARVRKGMYMRRGMQIICCSARMAFMDCWTV